MEYLTKKHLSKLIRFSEETSMVRPYSVLFYSLVKLYCTKIATYYFFMAILQHFRPFVTTFKNGFDM